MVALQELVMIDLHVHSLLHINLTFGMWTWNWWSFAPGFTHYVNKSRHCTEYTGRYCSPYWTWYGVLRCNLSKKNQVRHSKLTLALVPRLKTHEAGTSSDMTLRGRNFTPIEIRDRLVEAKINMYVISGFSICSDDLRRIICRSKWTAKCIRITVRNKVRKQLLCILPQGQAEYTIGSRLVVWQAARSNGADNPWWSPIVHSNSQVSFQGWEDALLSIYCLRRRSGKSSTFHVPLSKCWAFYGVHHFATEIHKKKNIWLAYPSRVLG